MESYFINIEDYSIKPYSNDGFSGQLYIGTHKKDKKKYIIKYREMRFACCEFVFSHIGRLLGADLPNTYFIKHNNDFYFSPYAVAIEYMENLKPFKINELNDDQLLQYIKINAMHIMFSQFDTIQIRMTDRGTITSFDFAESFFLPNILYAVDSDKATECCMTSFERFKNDYDLKSAINGLIGFMDEKISGISSVSSREIINNTLMDMLELEEQMFEPIIDAVEEYYGLNYSVFIEEYIGGLKEKIKEICVI